MKYSIHRCLSELKLLDNKIDRACRKSFIGYKKNSAVGEYDSHLPENDFAIAVKGNLDSAKALINRRKLIKEAIVNSNASTTVIVGGKYYTVASAIERKKSIEHEEHLLYNLKNQYAHVLKIVNNNNDKMEANLDKQLTTMIGGDNAKNEEIENFSALYRSQNGYTVLDSQDLKSVIEELEKEIDEFKSEVDCILSESNAITLVEIPE